MRNWDYLTIEQDQKLALTSEGLILLAARNVGTQLQTNGVHLVAYDIHPAAKVLDVVFMSAIQVTDPMVFNPVQFVIDESAAFNCPTIMWDNAIVEELYL